MLAVEYASGAAWHAAAVLDLSDAGCRLRVVDDLVPGSEVAVRFAAPLADGSTSATLGVAARVKWCDRDGRSYRAGLSFEAPPQGLDELLRALEQN